MCIRDSTKADGGRILNLKTGEPSTGVFWFLTASEPSAIKVEINKTEKFEIDKGKIEMWVQNRDSILIEKN